ncbi:MAG: Gfo/Idh/MocA family oxidoreductase [Armatimonadota bacterium]|nr:Gfo/Idh/MocA family oxidoreductase [Armatimonadota bacterium]
MPDKLRTVLVGCGSISRTWLNAVRDMDDVEVVGLVDINEEAAKQRQQEYSLPSAVVDTDLRRVLKHTNPDIVFDCSTPSAHAEVTITALEHGCHVLGEKPMADSMENAWKMINAAQDAGKVYAVMQNRRYDPRIRSLRRFLASGRIGDLTTLHSDFFIGAHFGGYRDRMEHVLLLDMAIHTFDQARLISGANPKAVYCKEWNPKGSWYDHDASAVCIFEMTDGIVYTYRGSWCAEGLSTTWESSWRCLCERGSVIWDGADGFQAQGVAETGGFLSKLEYIDVPVLADEKSGGHAGLIKDFVQCIKVGSTPETICTDNIHSLAMVFAAIESAETGGRVELSSLGKSGS